MQLIQFRLIQLIAITFSFCSLGFGLGDQEVLNFETPKGWKIIFQDSNKQQSILELVPQGESAANWTKRITIQTFQNTKRFEPEEFLLGMVELAKSQCQNVKSYSIKTSEEQNGFLFSQKLIVCEKGDKSEQFQIKAIKGKKNFYVAQIAFSTNLDDQEASRWDRWLKETTVKTGMNKK